MFRYKSGVKVPYDWQGYIFFLSRLYKSLSRERQHMILDLCHRCGGEYHAALFEFVTTDVTATAVCLKHYMSADTLYRCVRRYYEEFYREESGK